MKFTEHDKKKKEKERKQREEPLMFFEPSFEQLFERLSDPIHWLASFAGSIECLEADVTRVLGVPSYKLLSYSEEALESKLNTVKELLQRGFEEPNVVMQAYHSYEFLLEQPKEEIIK